jgi:hypothetical protein
LRELAKKWRLGEAHRRRWRMSTPVGQSVRERGNSILQVAQHRIYYARI